MKIISISIIIFILFSIPVSAGDQLLGTKTVGKLTMIAILSATAYVIKTLVERDQKEIARFHGRLGPPDKILEFQEGFDRWQLEWYGDHVYMLRNGVLYKGKK